MPKAPITIGIIVTFMFHSFLHFLARSKYLSFFSHSFSFILWSVDNFATSLFLLIIITYGRLAEIRCSACMTKSHWSLRVSFSRMLSCAYTICSNGQISVFCTIPSGSTYLHSRLQSYTPSVLICCIHLLCDWSFRLYHHITYIFCFIASYQFSFWYDWFLWRCVTYWPSTEPSIKTCTCVNKWKNSETSASSRSYRNITLTCGHGCIRWWWQMRTLTGSRWM